MEVTADYSFPDFRPRSPFPVCRFSKGMLQALVKLLDNIVFLKSRKGTCVCEDKIILILHLQSLGKERRPTCKPHIRPRGVLPYKRLMGMCRWMGSHFHDWSDYNEVAFSIELLEWGPNFRILGVSRDSKWDDSRLKRSESCCLLSLTISWH